VAARATEGAAPTAYTRGRAAPAGAATAGAGGRPADDLSRPSTAPPTPLRSVRRSTLPERNQPVPDTSTSVASLREAHSSGVQWEGGLASRSGSTISFDIVPWSIPISFALRPGEPVSHFIRRVSRGPDRRPAR